MIDIDKIKQLKISSEKEISSIAEHVFTPDQQRNEKEKQHFHLIKLIFIWAFLLFFVIIGLVIVLHLILSVHWRWLSANEISDLKSIFISGIGGALLTKFTKKLVE